MEKNDIWLLQRARMKDTAEANVTGYDSAFENDYMGKSEFEFGIHSSLVNVTQNFPQYQTFPHSLVSGDGRKLYVICKPENKDIIFEVLPEIANGKKRLGEPAFLDNMLAKPKERNKHLRNVDLWWDIDNHWFSVFGEETSLRLNLALTTLRNKWLASGKIK